MLRPATTAALVIATDYSRKPSAIPQSKTTEYGARAVGADLKAHRATVHTIFDRDQPLTSRHFLKAVERLGAGTQKPDQVLIYLGMNSVTYNVPGTAQLNTYLLPGDADVIGGWPNPNQPYARKQPLRSVSIQQFLNALFAIPTSSYILLVDGPFKLEEADDVLEDYARRKQFSIEILALGENGCRRPDGESGNGLFANEILRMLRSPSNEFSGGKLTGEVARRLEQAGLTPFRHSFGLDNFMFSYDWYPVVYPAPGPSEDNPFAQTHESVPEPPPPPQDEPLRAAREEPVPEDIIPPEPFQYPPDLRPPSASTPDWMKIHPKPTPTNAYTDAARDYVQQRLDCLRPESVAVGPNDSVIVKKPGELVCYSRQDTTSLPSAVTTTRNLVTSVTGKHIGVIGRDAGGFAVVIHDTENQETFRIPGEAQAGAFSSEGKVIWAGYVNGEARAFSLTSAAHVETVDFGEQAITALATFRHSLIAGCADGSVLLHSPSGLSVLAPASPTNESIESIATTCDGSLIVWCSQTEITICRNSLIDCTIPVQRHLARTIRLSSNGSMAICETYQNQALILDLTGGMASPQPFDGFQLEVRSASFADPSTLWVCGENRVERWDLNKTCFGGAL